MEKITINLGKPVRCISYNKDGDLLFAASDEGNVLVLNTVTKKIHGVYKDETAAIRTLSPSSDGCILLTGSALGSIIQWDVSTNKIKSKRKVDGRIRCIGWSPDNSKYYVIYIPLGATVKYKFEILDAVTNETMIETNYEEVSILRASAAIWSTDGKMIYVGHESGYVCAYNAISGKVEFEKKVHGGLITDIKLSLDNTMLITSSTDRTAKIISPQDLSTIKEFTSRFPINGVDFSPVYEELVFGGGQDAMKVTTTDQNNGGFFVKFFSSAMGTQIATVISQTHFSPIYSVRYHPFGAGFATADHAGCVGMYTFDSTYHEIQR